MNNTDTMRLADNFAIKELGQAYAHFVDRRDFDSLVMLFTPDAVLAGFDGDPIGQSPLYERRGRESIKQAMQGLLRYDVTHHMLGQHMIAFDPHNERVARGELYCNAQHKYSKDGAAWNRIMMIRYLDFYEQHSGMWHIADRRLAIEWVDVHRVGATDE